MSNVGRLAWPRAKCRSATALVLALCLLALSSRVLHTQPSRSNERPPLQVTGVVFDSVTGVPLPGAVVQLLRASDRTRARTVIADTLGRFGFANVEAGTWLLGFLHPRTDSIPGGRQPTN